MPKKLVIRGHVDNSTGYGQHVCAVVEGLQDLGVEVILLPTSIDREGDIPERVERAIHKKDPGFSKDLLLHIPRFKPQTTGWLEARVHYTTWEATRLDIKMVSNLESSVAVCVPSHWNLNCFSASGVTTPLYVVPEWVNNLTYNYSPVEMDGPTVFGCAARIFHGGNRKRLEKIVKAFRKAFKLSNKVRLKIKLSENCQINENLNDPRIEVVRVWMREDKLAEWYKSLTVFVSASASEGWGLHQHQAMACGRSIVSPIYGGVQEYANEHTSYAVPFSYVEAEKPYHGLWTDVEVDELADAMARVHADRSTAATKGSMSYSSASRFSLENMAAKLYAVLEKHRIFID